MGPHGLHGVEYEWGGGFWVIFVCFNTDYKDCSGLWGKVMLVYARERDVYSML